MAKIPKITRSVHVSEQHAASLYALVDWYEKMLTHYHKLIDNDSPVRQKWSKEYCEELKESLLKGIEEMN